MLALLLGKALEHASAAVLKKHLLFPIALWELLVAAWRLVDYLPTDAGTPRAVTHDRKLSAVMLLAAVEQVKSYLQPETAVSQLTCTTRPPLFICNTR